MKTLSLLLLSLGLLPCSADLPAQAPAPQVQEAYSTQDALKDTTAVFHILSHVNPLCCSIKYPALRDEENLPVPEQIRQISHLKGWTGDLRNWEPVQDLSKKDWTVPQQLQKKNPPGMS